MKRRPATSLATYDINLLGAWYDALGKDTIIILYALSFLLVGTTPHLVIFVQDFEQCDPVIIQDVFYICR